MTSTRDKNSPANYCLEQRGLKQTRDNLAFYNSPNGHAYYPALPRHYIPSHMPVDILSNNPIDIESSLFGIDSNNLVNPKCPVQPDLRYLPEVSFFSTPEIVKHEMVRQDKTQRPIIYQ